MKKNALAAFAATIAIAGSASAYPGYTTNPVNLRAGPGLNYPVIVMLGDDQPVEINGCLAQYNWCDVQTGPYRGWVSGPFLQGVYDDRDEFITQYGPQIGVPIISFELNDYWGRYYKDRPFYRERDRYVNIRHDSHRVAPPRNDHGDDHHDNRDKRFSDGQHNNIAGQHNSIPGNAQHDNRQPADHHDNRGDRHDDNSHGRDNDHH